MPLTDRSTGQSFLDSSHNVVRSDLACDHFKILANAVYFLNDHEKLVDILSLSALISISKYLY